MKSKVSYRTEDGSIDEKEVLSRYISRVINTHGEIIDDVVQSEVILRRTPSGRFEIRATLIEDGRKITQLKLQRYTTASGKPHDLSFSFIGDEITKLRWFLNNINSVALPKDGSSTRLELAEVEALLSDHDQVAEIVANDPNLLKAIIEKDITTTDILSLTHKKAQLDIFRQLLESTDFFDSYKAKHSSSSPEGAWQHFFESNTWIFGFGLQYVFGDSLPDMKLEQVTTGADVFGKGKRIDALLRTRGTIQSIALAEIKRHDTELLKKKEYRPGCFMESKELGGGIAQLRMTSELLLKKIAQKTDLTDSEGNLIGESIFSTKPKTFLVIGTLSEFENEHGVNQARLASFERFRNSLTDIEVITYDELYERAKGIVEHIKTLSDS